MGFKNIRILLAALILSVMATAPAAAMTLIRDTEIEETLRSWMTPVIQSAGLNPDAVKIILVSSPEVNAFVAGGSNVFITTGLLQTATDAREVMGVVAHELGHIAGGHLIRGREAMERASYEAMIGALLGAGTMLGTGQGDVGGAIMSGSNAMATSSFLSFSRAQESSADQAGLRFLQGAGYTADGMVTFLRKLEGQELLPASQQNPYMRTHPLTVDRINAMTAGAERSPYHNKPLPAGWPQEFDLIRAKIMAFTEPNRVAWDYGDQDQSLAARYARSIAAYRDSRIDDALKGIDAMIAEQPKNPYFWELKGQILKEGGRVSQSIAPYEKAVALKPDAPLIRVDLAHALLEGAPNNDKATAEAEKHLKAALARDKRNDDAFRLLALIYGRQGDEGMAQLNLAEEAVLENRRGEARSHIAAALRSLPAGGRARLQANDLKAYIDAAWTGDEKKR